MSTRSKRTRRHYRYSPAPIVHLFGLRNYRTLASEIKSPTHNPRLRLWQLYIRYENAQSYQVFFNSLLRNMDELSPTGGNLVSGGEAEWCKIGNESAIWTGRGHSSANMLSTCQPAISKPTPYPWPVPKYYLQILRYLPNFRNISPLLFMSCHCVLNDEKKSS